MPLPEVLAPLPHDTQYVLDELLDQYVINPFAHSIICLYADRTELDRQLEAVKPMYRIGPALDRFAHDIASGMPTDDQKAFFAATLIREPGRLIAAAEVLADWNYDDRTVGGMLEPIRQRKLIDKEGRPFPKINKRLHSPASIRHYIATLRDPDTTVALRSAAANLRKLPWPDGPDDACGLERFFGQAQARYEEARRRGLEQFFKRTKQGKEQRKALVRSVEAATAALGEDAARALVHNKSICLQGTLYDWIVSADLQGIGHGGMNITLQRGGKKLTNMCLFFPDCPALDQIAALSMYIASDNELELIDTGNLYHVSSAGAADPFIAERLARNRDWVPEAEPYEVVNRYERKREYAAKMTPLYTTILTRFVWEDDTDKLEAFLRSYIDTPDEFRTGIAA